MLRLIVSEFRYALCAKLIVGDEIKWFEKRLCSSPEGDEILLYQFLNFLKDNLFPLLPVQEIKIECTQEAMKRFKWMLEFAFSVVGNTNEALRKFDPWGDQGSATLMVNVDENVRYKEISDSFSDKDCVLYESISSGFNPETRQFEPVDLPWTLEELENNLAEWAAGTVVTINNYLSEQYINHLRVHLPTFLRHLGVRMYCIDNDNYDALPHGYLMKAFYHVDGCKRFSVTPEEQEPWDRMNGLKNIHYIAVPRDYSKFTYPAELPDDYSVLVLSNSRIDHVRHHLPSITYILDSLDRNKLITDLHLWWCAMRYLNMNVLWVSDEDKMLFNARIQNHFFSVTQYLKYYFIQNLDSDRQIDIYGDAGWQKIFPYWFQGKYLETCEKHRLLLERRHILLLFNHGLNYLNAPGPVFDAIQTTLPFATWATLVKSEELGGMGHLEYDNVSQLNDIVIDINRRIKECSFLDSLDYYRNRLHGNMLWMQKEIMGTWSFNEFYSEHNELHRKLEDKVKQYLSDHEPKIREMFEALCITHEVPANYKESHYYQQPFVERITSGLG